MNFVFLFQVLQSWLQGLPDDYAVKDLINEIKDWIEEGYVDPKIWKRFQNCVTPGVLPTFSERRSSGKRSGSASPTGESATDPTAPSTSATADGLQIEQSSSANSDTALKVLIYELNNLFEEGYLDSTIWKRLRSSVSPDVLPMFRKHLESAFLISKKKAARAGGDSAVLGKMH